MADALLDMFGSRLIEDAARLQRSLNEKGREYPRKRGKSSMFKQTSR